MDRNISTSLNGVGNMRILPFKRFCNDRTAQNVQTAPIEKNSAFVMAKPSTGILTLQDITNPASRTTDKPKILFLIPSNASIPLHLNLPLRSSASSNNATAAVVNAKNIPELIDLVSDEEEEEENVQRDDDAILAQVAHTEEVTTHDEEDNSEKPRFANQIIRTVAIKCLFDDCSQLIQNKNNLQNSYQIVEGHYQSEHQMKPLAQRCFACLSYQVGDKQHLTSAHPNHSLWSCATCDKEFSTYPSLAKHYQLWHVEGTFSCAKKNCTFVSNYRVDIYRHNRTYHRLIKCSVKDCGLLFSSELDYTKHQWVHLGLKQFRCNWGHGCHYATKTKNPVVTHIRTVHFNLPSTKRAQKIRRIVDDRDPNQYVYAMSLDEAKLFDQISK